MMEDKIYGKFVSKEITKLDKKEEKLISKLLIDATLPLSKLANELRLSKSNIARRINILEKREIILGYNAFIDTNKIGFKTYLLFIQTKCTDETKEKIIGDLAKLKFVYGILELTGKYNLLIGTYSKENFELNIEKILNLIEYRDFKIQEIVTYFPRVDYTKDLFSEKGDINFNKEIIEVDKTDLEILKILAKNCRITKTKIGERLNLSRETINYRIKNLIKKGIIPKFQAGVNPFSLGFEAYLLRIILSKPTKKEAIIKFLANTLRCNTILYSNFEILAFIHFKTHREYRELEKKILPFKEAIFEYSFEMCKEQYKLEWFSE